VRDHFTTAAMMRGIDALYETALENWGRRKRA